MNIWETFSSFIHSQADCQQLTRSASEKKNWQTWIMVPYIFLPHPCWRTSLFVSFVHLFPWETLGLIPFSYRMYNKLVLNLGRILVSMGRIWDTDVNYCNIDLIAQNLTIVHMVNGKIVHKVNCSNEANTHKKRLGTTTLFVKKI